MEASKMFDVAQHEGAKKLMSLEERMATIPVGSIWVCTSFSHALAVV